MNRLTSTTTLLNQPSFSFATKSLKIIKIRMRTVESIKKITKVCCFINLGYEDGGCFKNETGCWKIGKS